MKFLLSLLLALSICARLHADTPPTFIQEAEVAWNSATSPKTTASFNVLAGDILVAFSIQENWDGIEPVIIATGGSLTWTDQQTIGIASYTRLALTTAVVDVDKAMTVSFTRAGGGSFWYGGNVLTFRTSNGVGASSKTNVSSGAPSLSLTTTQANSVIVVASGDWNAVTTSRTWRTVNSITPTSANGFERTYFADASHYTVYGAYYTDAGATGAKTVGLSAPGGQKYSIAAVEIKGTTGGTPPSTSSRRMAQ